MLIHNIATRFLQNELERIETNLTWIDSAYRPGLTAEYERRKQAVCNLISIAVTNEATLDAIEQQIRDAERLLDETANRVVEDKMRLTLKIDTAYLHGLYNRLQHAIEDHTYTYALANVKRL